MKNNYVFDPGSFAYIQVCVCVCVCLIMHVSGVHLWQEIMECLSPAVFQADWNATDPDWLKSAEKHREQGN